MEVLVKYQAQKNFKDKVTKKEVKLNDVLEVSIERMKELNAKNAGRVIDIIIKDNEKDGNSTEEKDTTKDENIKEDLGVKETKCSREDLEKMTVNQLKDFAEENKIELTKEKKTEIIEEILNNF
jgi:hypothetical protein|nr:MAG TPA: HeH/LEM domain [Caudoviricetes sp.]